MSGQSRLAVDGSQLVSKITSKHEAADMGVGSAPMKVPNHTCLEVQLLLHKGKMVLVPSTQDDCVDTYACTILEERTVTVDVGEQRYRRKVLRKVPTHGRCAPRVGHAAHAVLVALEAAKWATVAV